MFKFARYFFAVFIITTIIPLVLMFSWNHHQMEHMMHDKNQHFLDFETRKLKKTTEQYLKIRQGFILEKMLDIPLPQISLDKLKDVFKNAKIDLIYDKNIDRVQSYYEATDEDLYNVIIVPIKDSEIKGIKIKEKVNLNELHPNGPFDIEIYLGDKITQKNLLQTIKNPFAPPHPQKPPHFMENKMSERTENKEILITDNNNKTVALLVLKFRHMHPPMPMPPHAGGPPDEFRPPGPPGPPQPFENEIGLLILLAGTVFSLLTGFYLSKNFIDPLLILSNAIKQVQQGNLLSEINTHVKQEHIQDIFNNFNQMIKGLKEKDLLRKSFVTSLTHDLKTPLIAQERSLGLIAKEFESLGMKKEYELAKGIEKNNSHLLRMVDLILESYRYEFDELNLVISNINLSELVNNCYHKLHSLIEEKNIEFINHIPVDFPVINGDITSFKRIFLNLISNSIDSINQNGKIEINAENLNNSINISIKDNGVGIAHEDLTHIFDRYYTGKSDDRKIGSGLGLYVCKKLVELHDGEITVKSEVNKYTEFIIKLPKRG